MELFEGRVTQCQMLVVRNSIFFLYHSFDSGGWILCANTHTTMMGRKRFRKWIKHTTSCSANSVNGWHWYMFRRSISGKFSLSTCIAYTQRILGWPTFHDLMTFARMIRPYTLNLVFIHLWHFSVISYRLLSLLEFVILSFIQKSTSVQWNGEKYNYKKHVAERVAHMENSLENFSIASLLCDQSSVYGKNCGDSPHRTYIYIHSVRF